MFESPHLTSLFPIKGLITHISQILFSSYKLASNITLSIIPIHLDPSQDVDNDGNDNN
jgi:hypothetical protein